MRTEDPMRIVGVDFDLPLDEAYALAELCKRITFSDARGCAVDEEEAYRIINATNKLRDALAENGVRVR